MYLCIHLYIYMYVYICTYTCLYISVNILLYIAVFTGIYISVYIPDVSVYTFICTCIDRLSLHVYYLSIYFFAWRMWLGSSRKWDFVSLIVLGTVVGYLPYTAQVYIFGFCIRIHKPVHTSMYTSYIYIFFQLYYTLLYITMLCCAVLCYTEYWYDVVSTLYLYCIGKRKCSCFRFISFTLSG